MYDMQWQIPAAPLNAQLSNDAGGELRDKILDELSVAAHDIEAVLANNPDPSYVGVLSNLLQAVRLAERIVDEAWSSFHA
jgi:hypothetical protein